MDDTNMKDERRARFERRRRAESKKQALLARERKTQEQRYYRDLSRGILTRTTGDEREPWL